VGVFTVVTGVAGSGKSSLIHQVFLRQHPDAVMIDQSGVGTSTRSNPATYTGLHMSDIGHLLEVINRLVDTGNTVIVIEHNLDVIKNADWIIDMGPEGGNKGGKVIFEGTPKQLLGATHSLTGAALRSSI
jgi:excinuclease UvrABC ATPase subunit